MTITGTGTLGPIGWLISSVFGEMYTLAFGLIFFMGAFLLYILSTPVFLFRYILIKIAASVRPDLEKIVSAQGNIFSDDLFTSKAPRCSIVIPCVIEGHLSVEEGRTLFLDMLSMKDTKSGHTLYPEFQMYLEKWFGFCFWKSDPHFDIENHVKCVNDDDHDKAGSEKINSEDIRRLVEKLLNKRFLSMRSPWEVFIVNNYDDPGLSEEAKTVLVVRFHHTLADGYSILYALIEGVLKTPLESLQLPTPNFVSRGVISELWFFLTFPFQLVHDISHYFIKGIRKNPWNTSDDKKAWKQLYGNTKPVKMQKIKDVKDGLGVSFTSVLLAAVSSSISRVIKSKERGKAGNIMEQEQLQRAPFFIPLPLPRHPNSLTNHVTGAQIDLPLENYSDPTMRVRECERLLQQQKRSTIPLLLLFVANTLGLHPSHFCGKLTANRVNIGGLTSFPAGTGDIKVGIRESRLLAVDFAVGALTGISGVAFMAVSYGKYLRFGITAESAVLSRKDVDGLLQLVNDEIDLLHDIVMTTYTSTFNNAT